MGYDVHITRAEDWSENEDAPISLEEWERFVDGDPELRPDPDNGMPMAVWTAHPDTELLSLHPGSRACFSTGALV